MQANTMYYKVVPTRAKDFNIICGFNPKLVFATAERVTSAVYNVTAEHAEAIAKQHAADLNAANVQDVTSDAVWKKINKAAETVDIAPGNFAQMGIGAYMQ